MGYVVVLHDCSFIHRAWHDNPLKLDALLEREAPKGVRHVAVGINGLYALILNDGRPNRQANCWTTPAERGVRWRCVPMAY
jgi:hypothetical protein